MAQKRKDYFLIHDQNARNDLKIMAMMSDWGVEGYGMFWIIVENFRSTTKYKIDRKPNNLKSIAHQMRCNVETAERFVEDCINKYELFQGDKDFFYSMRLIEDMDKMETIKEKQSEGGREAMRRRYSNNTNDINSNHKLETLNNITLNHIRDLDGTYKSPVSNLERDWEE